jgi:alcohol dehydrogenase class IV
MISGMTLANAGLGYYTWFCVFNRWFFEIPHGLVCARMMKPVNQITIRKLRKENPQNVGLFKYARIGKLFSEDKNRNDEDYIDILMQVIEKYTEQFELKKLGDYGIKKSDFSRIIKETGNKYNPISLNSEEMEEALSMAL